MTVDETLEQWHPEMQIDWDALRENTREYRDGLELVEQPDALRNIKLLPYQREALAWFRAQESSQFSGGILADQMGMGAPFVC